MCGLVIMQFVKRSLELYKATRQWQLNQFINLLVMEGVVYFLAYVRVSSFLSHVHPLLHLYRKTKQLMIFL